MQYVPVRVSTLRGDQKISFDAFVQINEKFILYLRSGDSFEGARLTKLKEKKLRKMFIKPEHEESYRQYIQTNIEQAYSDKSTQTIENRSQVVQGLQQAAAEDVMERPEDAVAYNAAKEGSKQFSQFLLKEANSLKALLSIENTDQSLTHHGVTVASWAVGLAKKLGLQENKELHLLSLGALLHDFGHLSSGLAINKPATEFSKEEMEKYREHSMTGANLVKDQKHYDTTVIRIILEHEELINGTGFPKKLMEKDMHPMSVLVASANALDRLITYEKMKPQDAIKYLFVNRLGLYPLAHANALKAIITENGL